MRSDKTEEIDQGIERAGFVVVLEDSPEIQHGVLRKTTMGVNFAGSYCRRSLAA
jgi:hypothetical protein